MPRRAPEVLRYFLRTRSADSLEGVARWRLAEETVRRSVVEVDEALQWLVAHCYLVEQSARGTAPLFSLNTSKLADIRSLLGERVGEDGT